MIHLLSRYRLRYAKIYTAAYEIYGLLRAPVLITYVDNSISKFVKIDHDNDFQETCSSNTKPMSQLPPKVRTRCR